MLKSIDKFLNYITMYRLILYFLFGLIAIAALFGQFKILPYSPLAILYSTAILLFISWLTNSIFSKLWKTQTNVESTYITALILALIISPPQAGQYLTIVPFLVWAAIWSMAAKYVIAYGKKHIFNPAAFAVALTAITLGQSATWWVGTWSLLPFVAIGGLMVTRKIRRFDLVTSFFVTALVTTVIFHISSQGLLVSLEKTFTETAICFFAFIMLTEPLTTPPTKWTQIIYGGLVGILFVPNIHIGALYSTPELAICAGNILSFILSPKRKYLLTVRTSNKIALDTGEFIFKSDHSIPFKPGQYLEWTLSHPEVDSRGNRRYFTIASSPTEPEIRLGVKFNSKSSSFKKHLATLGPDDKILVGQLAGNFTLPRDPTLKLAFIAGGIGITPFRSMIKYISDKGEKRDVVLVYSNKTKEEIAYIDILDEAYEKFGLKTVATLTDMDHIPADWHGYVGFITPEMIIKEIPDYMDRIFYISGPNSMVEACSNTLKNMGVERKNIKKDFFPGFA